MSGERIEFDVTPEQAGARIDRVIAAALDDWSRSRIQKIIADGQVWRDGEIATKSDKLSEGETVEILLPALEPQQLQPVPMELAILAEDDDWLVLNKAPGVVVHPGAGTGDDTLAHGLLHHCGPTLAGVGHPLRPGIVHRLDKDTSGVMVVAKTPRSFLKLSKAFSERATEKYYLAWVSGVPELLAGRIEQPIGRHATHRTRMTVRDDGRPARTDWRRVAVFPERALALLEFRIHTGRTHQVRVHSQHLGHPLLGDAAYSYRPKQTHPPVPRVMLHAARLGITHPRTGEPAIFEAPLPDDFLQLRSEVRQ